MPTPSDPRPVPEKSYREMADRAQAGLDEQNRAVEECRPAASGHFSIIVARVPTYLGLLSFIVFVRVVFALRQYETENNHLTPAMIGHAMGDNCRNQAIALKTRSVSVMGIFRQLTPLA